MRLDVTASDSTSSAGYLHRWFRRGLTPPLSVASSFQLPDPQGRAGGACTAALLQVLYDGDTPQDRGASWVDVLRQSEFRDAEEGTRDPGVARFRPGRCRAKFVVLSPPLSLSLGSAREFSSQ